jgi:hypothetical protein
MIRRLKAFTKDMTDYHVDRNNQKIQKTMAPQEARERELFNLGLVLIESANWGDAGVANEFIDAGFPINFQHPITKKTTLHVAVMITATGLTKTLMESGKCDLLLTDKKGNLVAGLAYTQGHDIEMYDLIRAETVQQANERGISADFSFEL